MAVGSRCPYNIHVLPSRPLIVMIPLSYITAHRGMHWWTRVLSGRYGAAARRPVDAPLLFIKLTFAINIILERTLALSLPLLCLLDTEASRDIRIIPFALFAVAVVIPAVARGHRVNRSHGGSVTAMTSLDKKKHKQMSIDYVPSELMTPRGPVSGLRAPLGKIA